MPPLTCPKAMQNGVDHTENINRLNRISGQIEGIKKMIEEHRCCRDILIQLRAVRSALKSVETNILQKQLKHCLIDSFGEEYDKEEQIQELEKLLNRFND